ncbi:MULTISPECIES: GNAT family N-acetyltransferase [Dermacoccus]|uniref:N-acetyltransferase n=2 Tax=Dermacoccus TaxID=57495 RepID=A0A417ZBZ4_9MICO|nr:GNAT family N-acetyltransferase [Dermacoccus abyssi]RHW48157.1 N-acetyltransferase [Dermacoccus abyssi]
MSDFTTERLVLHPATPDEAERIVGRDPAPDDLWAEDFPFEGDVIGATMFLRATNTSGDQQPFGFYVIIRRSDGRAVGGIGFKGQPQDGSVEIGYGLVPSARGAGFAAEASRALIDAARELGLDHVVAATAMDNIASQRTLEHAGMSRVGEQGDEYQYRIDL